MLNLDKKSVNTIFKSKSDVGTLEEKINSRESEIEYQIRLQHLLTIYLGTQID